MQKRTLQILVVLIAVLMLSTTVWAKKRYSKRCWWTNPFVAIWLAVGSLQQQVNQIELETGPQGPPGPRGPAGPPGLKGEKGDPAPLVVAVCPRCNFSYLELDGIELPGAILAGSYMGSVQMAGANLAEAYMDSVYLGSAVLTGADLTGTNLTGATLTGANLTDVIFSNTTMVGANMQGAITTGADLSSNPAIVYGNTICPDGTNTDYNGGTCEGHEYVPVP